MVPGQCIHQLATEHRQHTALLRPRYVDLTAVRQLPLTLSLTPPTWLQSSNTGTTLAALGCGSSGVDAQYKSCAVASPDHEDYIAVDVGRDLTCGLLEDGLAECCKCFMAGLADGPAPQRSCQLTGDLGRKCEALGGDGTQQQNHLILFLHGLQLCKHVAGGNDADQQLGNGQDTTVTSRTSPVTQVGNYTTYTQISTASGGAFVCGVSKACTQLSAPTIKSTVLTSNNTVRVTMEPPTTSASECWTARIAEQEDFEVL